MTVAMNQLQSRRRLRVLSVILLLLLPILWLHMLGWAESQQLRLQLAELEDEPIVMTATGIPMPDSLARKAIPTRYYKAAADLTSILPGFSELLGLNVAAAASSPTRTINAVFERQLGDVVTRNGEAMRLLAVANTGNVMSPGNQIPELRLDGQDLNRLWRLASAHVALFTAKKQWGAAAGAMVQSLALLPLFDLDLRRYGMPHKSAAMWEQVPQIGFLLESGRIEPEALDAITRALSSAIADDDLRRHWAFGRTRFANDYVRPLIGPSRARHVGWYLWPMRPMFEREAGETLKMYAEIERISARPWPARIDAVLDLPTTNSSRFSWRFEKGPIVESARRTAAAFANATALQRAALAAIAVERHRQATGQLPQALTELVPAYLPELPLDPFTGGPMRYRQSGEGYTVYSFGRDRSDDGGVLLQSVDRGTIDRQKGKDVGLTVRHSGL